VPAFLSTISQPRRIFTIVHLHLLLNHLPIIVPGVALVLVALALRRRDDYLARVAMAILVAGAVTALPSYLTGEGAEHAVRDLPGVTRELIERHSDIALVAAIVLGVLGAFALWALWRYRRPAQLPRTVVGLTLAGTVVASALMAYTGLLGGQIRHTEARPDFVAPAHAASGTGGSTGRGQPDER
jgi:uncharacterized membrane protein